MLNNFVMPDLLPAFPEIFLLFMACLILLADLAVGRKWRSIVALMSVGALMLCAAITWFTADGHSTLTFNNMFVDDLLSDGLKLLTYAAVITVIVYSRGYLKARNLDKAEFYLLLLFATLGMMVMISANHLLALYLGLELLSLSLYALVAMDRDSAIATEAAMKYFVLGALASGLLLYGMSMLYGASGTLEIGAIAQDIYQGDYNHMVMILGLVFVVAGIAFKLGVVPFHMWIPDVYHGAPTPITLLIASAPKFAAFAMVMRLLVSGMFDLAPQWQNLLLVLAVLSIGLGNLAAIAQSNIKRMLAYSTISHMGFMVLALSAGVVAGDRSYALQAYTSAMYYTVAYVLMSLAAFGMILLLSRPGFEADRLDDFKGLNKRSPWFAAVMLALMFSLAGIPFFIGFFAKFSVLTVIVAANHVGVAVFAVMFSLIGAFYYLRVVKLMYFDAPLDHEPIQAELPFRILLSANGIAVVALGLFPQFVIVPCLVALRLSLGA
jgi:NADH-quinone oxidoreductase subunit N